MTWHFPEEQPNAPQRTLIAAPAPQRTLVAAPAPTSAPVMSRAEVNEILERARLRREKAEQDKAQARAAHLASVQRSAERISPDVDLLKAINAKYFHTENGYGMFLHYRDRLLNRSQRAAALDELSADPDLKPFVDRARQ